MGFLKRILRSNGLDGSDLAGRVGSFEQLDEEQLQAHLENARYGAFELTDAVRPSFSLDIVPKQGFRKDEYRDDQSGATVPVVMASASRPYLMELFMDLIDPLGPVVDVVLETSHTSASGHEDMYREHIDMPVLKSILWDFEDLLLNDGCTGIAVVNPAKQQEVQFDEHKLLIVYGQPLEQFEQIMIERDVYPDDSIRFITEAEHVHSSNERFVSQFESLQSRLGLDCNWSSGTESAY